MESNFGESDCVSDISSLWSLIQLLCPLSKVLLCPWAIPPPWGRGGEPPQGAGCKAYRHKWVQGAGERQHEEQGRCSAPAQQWGWSMALAPGFPPNKLCQGFPAQLHQDPWWKNTYSQNVQCGTFLWGLGKITRVTFENCWVQGWSPYTSLGIFLPLKCRLKYLLWRRRCFPRVENFVLWKSIYSQGLYGQSGEGMTPAIHPF